MPREKQFYTPLTAELRQCIKNLRYRYETEEDFCKAAGIGGKHYWSLVSDYGKPAISDVTLDQIFTGCEADTNIREYNWYRSAGLKWSAIGARKAWIPVDIWNGPYTDLGPPVVFEPCEPLEPMSDEDREKLRLGYLPTGKLYL